MLKLIGFIMTAWMSIYMYFNLFNLNDIFPSSAPCSLQISEKNSIIKTLLQMYSPDSCNRMFTHMDSKSWTSNICQSSSVRSGFVVMLPPRTGSLTDSRRTQLQCSMPNFMQTSSVVVWTIAESHQGQWRSKIFSVLREGILNKLKEKLTVKF